MIVGIPNPGVWGWPWRGLGVNRKITGYAPDCFKDGQAWLIDTGLPEITLTSEESTEASAKGYTWQNYGYVSGGYVYGQNLQISSIRKDTFLHIDETGKCWIIRCSVTVVDDSNATITLSAKRFGLFGTGEHYWQTVIKPVVCQKIYVDDSCWTVEDVWTNGSKALLSIGRVVFSRRSIYSLIEIVPDISGDTFNANVSEINGGADTSDVFYSASEDLGGPDGLDIPSPVDTPHGIKFDSVKFIPFLIMQGAEGYTVKAFSAHYDSSGNADLLRVKLSSLSGDHVFESVSSWLETTGGDTFVAYYLAVFNISSYVKLEILKNNDVVLDIISSHANNTLYYEKSYWSNYANNYVWYYGTGDEYKTGYMSDHEYAGSSSLEDFLLFIGEMSGSEQFPYTPYNKEITFYGSVPEDNGLFGYYYAPPNAHGLYRKINTTADYAFWGWITPAGTISYTPDEPDTLPESLYWAMNRKTGAWSFSPTVICYV